MMDSHVKNFIYLNFIRYWKKHFIFLHFWQQGIKKAFPLSNQRINILNLRTPPSFDVRLRITS